jgi:N-acetylglucosaminyldiphosphoundecaprenol N-acetyl-beta-D-mannosaminyltransferase
MNEMIEVDVLGTSVNICTKIELITSAEKALSQQKKTFNFLSVNSIKIINAQKDVELRNYINDADIVYPDAIGLCYGIRILYKKMQERIPGYEFHFDVLDICNKKKLSVYVLGAKESVLSQAIRLYKKKYPKINFVGYNDGYFSEQYFRKHILKNIITHKPSLVIVAMGGKLQEYFIKQIQNEHCVSLLMGVGGSLDAFIGSSPRAPKWMLDLGFEWLYRLMKEPWRYKAMAPLPKFAYQILKKKILS